MQKHKNIFNQSSLDWLELFYRYLFDEKQRNLFAQDILRKVERERIMIDQNLDFFVPNIYIDKLNIDMIDYDPNIDPNKK